MHYFTSSKIEISAEKRRWSLSYDPHFVFVFAECFCQRVLDNWAVFSPTRRKYSTSDNQLGWSTSLMSLEPLSTVAPAVGEDERPPRHGRDALFIPVSTGYRMPPSFRFSTSFRTATSARTCCLPTRSDDNHFLKPPRPWRHMMRNDGMWGTCACESRGQLARATSYKSVQCYHKEHERY